jgi:hypothetical protein
MWGTHILPADSDIQVDIGSIFSSSNQAVMKKEQLQSVMGNLPALSAPVMARPIEHELYTIGDAQLR